MGKKVKYVYAWQKLSLRGLKKADVGEGSAFFFSRKKTGKDGEKAIYLQRPVFFYLDLLLDK